MCHDFSSPPKAVTNDELLEAVSSYGESGNSHNERLVFLTPRLHVALVEVFRKLSKSGVCPECGTKNANVLPSRGDCKTCIASRITALS